MNNKERQSLEKAVTKLVEGIWKWQNNECVIILTPSLRLGTILEYDFDSMPACEPKKGVVVGNFDIHTLEEYAGITKDCTLGDKSLGIDIITTFIEDAIDDGDFEEEIIEFLD